MRCSRGSLARGSRLHRKAGWIEANATILARRAKNAKTGAAHLWEDGATPAGILVAIRLGRTEATEPHLNFNRARLVICSEFLPRNGGKSL